MKSDCKQGTSVLRRVLETKTREALKKSVDKVIMVQIFPVALFQIKLGRNYK